MMQEMYYSVDIESAGPIPGKFSMLSIGACIVGDMTKTFYSELKPISKDFDPKAMEVTGFDLDKLQKDGQDPREVMSLFEKWIASNSQDKKPVFVGFNASYDWQFINWYFHTYLSHNPFGFGALDIKSYYMGLSKNPWSETTSSKLPPEFQPDIPQTHNALDDALAQASIFEKLLMHKS